MEKNKKKKRLFLKTVICVAACALGITAGVKVYAGIDSGFFTPIEGLNYETWTGEDGPEPVIPEKQSKTVKYPEALVSMGEVHTGTYDRHTHKEISDIVYYKLKKDGTAKLLWKGRLEPYKQADPDTGNVDTIQPPKVLIKNKKKIKKIKNHSYIKMDSVKLATIHGRRNYRYYIEYKGYLYATYSYTE